MHFVEPRECAKWRGAWYIRTKRLSPNWGQRALEKLHQVPWRCYSSENQTWKSNPQFPTLAVLSSKLYFVASEVTLKSPQLEVGSKTLGKLELAWDVKERNFEERKEDKRKADFSQLVLPLDQTSLMLNITAGCVVLSRPVREVLLVWEMELASPRQKRAAEVGFEQPLRWPRREKLQLTYFQHTKVLKQLNAFIKFDDFVLFATDTIH